jgi:DNA-binding transcriptional ArsR family regulator
MTLDRRALSIIPVRAIGMVRKASSWRVLAALGHHASATGLCYPSQATLGELAGGMDQAAVSRAVKDLYDLGLVRMLLPVGPKLRGSFQKQNRYQVLWTPHAPMPNEREIEIAWGARTNRW